MTEKRLNYDREMGRKVAVVVVAVVLGCSSLIIIISNEIAAGQPTNYSNAFGSGRKLMMQTENVSETREKPDDTARRDPLDNLKKYRGGYDIRNKHYWSSTAFTGIYGYAIGALWLLCGFVYLVATTFCCCKHRNTKQQQQQQKKKKKRPPCHKQCYLWPSLSAIFFTIIAITASGVALGGNVKFHSKAKTVIDIIIDTADEATVTINSTTGAMKNITTNLQDSNMVGADEATRFLISTSNRLDREAANIEREARKNRKAIDKGLQIVFILTTVIMTVNLIAAIALAVCGTLKFRRALHLLIVLCWLLTALCWLLFGVYFFLENFAEDTCTALEDFQEDPYNSSLSSILPCDELVSAKPILSDVRMGIYNVVEEINANLSNVFHICNPFSEPPEYRYQPDDCSDTAVRIGDIPQLLKILTCSDADCIGGIYISQDDLKTVVSYTSSIQNLLNAYPGMESLVECQTVADAFSEIRQRHCKSLKKYAKMVWAGMVVLSVVMVALILIWTIGARHDQEYRHSEGSVKPHSTTETTPTLESGTGKGSQQ